MTDLTTTPPIHLLHITDTHLYRDSEGTLLKMNTRNSLDHVIKFAKQNETEIDLILATGDISQDGSVEAYKSFMNIIADLGVPYRWIPGNHDNPDVMEEVAYGTNICEKLIQVNNWQIVLLNTCVLGQAHGNLAAGEIEFLEDNLHIVESDVSVDHCLICLHHNPTKANASWMEEIGLNNGEQFFEIIAQFKKPRCVVYGHIHQELDYVHDDIRCLCTPSTCIQFKPNVTSFAEDKVNPGYRTLRLFEDGSIDTTVIRVNGFNSRLEYNGTE